MISEIPYLGKIIRVDSGSVEVEVSDKIPSAAPIINGRLYKIGQIGTFVKFPVGNILLTSTIENIICLFSVIVFLYRCANIVKTY